MAGSGMLIQSQADAILESTFTPQIGPSGFTFAGKRTWVRVGKPHICELVRFNLTKGAGITPIWGVALDFVPEVTGPSLKWKRHPESLYFDLEWFPLDYDEEVRAETAKRSARFMDAAGSGILKLRHEPEPKIEKWYLSLLDSAEVFQAKTTALAGKTIAEAIPFFAGIPDLEQVREKLAFQRNYQFQGLGFFNHIQPPLAYAFLLARLGRADEASNAYQEYQARIGSGEGAKAGLDGAFVEAKTHPF
jgi:hypothetical protein